MLRLLVLPIIGVAISILISVAPSFSQPSITDRAILFGSPDVPPTALPTPFPPRSGAHDLPIVPATEFVAYPECHELFCILTWVPEIMQSVGGWCWNATAQIIMQYHGVPKSQCQIADQVYDGVFNPAPPPPCCDVDSNPDARCGVASGGQPQWAFEVNGFTSSPPLGTGLPILSWAERRNELQSDRPYISYVRRWAGNTMHTIVLKGHLDIAVTINGSIVHVRQVYLYDPQNEHSEWLDYDVFSHAGTDGQCRFRDPDPISQHVICGDVYEIQQ